MSYQKSNIDYGQLCKALEEGDNVTALNLIINNNDVNDPDLRVIYNWILIVYETLKTFLEVISLKFHKTNDELVNNKLVNITVKCSECDYWNKETNVIKNFTKVFEKLLEEVCEEKNIEATASNNANVNHPNINNRPNWISIISEAVDIIIRILDHESYIFDENHNNYELINGVIQYNNTLGACLFIRRGTFLEEEWNGLLLEAIEKKNETIFQMLIDKGLSLNYNIGIQYICPDGSTLLHKAIKNNFKAEIIQTLLKFNSPVNAVNHDMLTPLLIACKMELENQLEIIEALLHYNANVNCNDSNLMTPLHFACQAQNLEVVTVLLKKGANPNAKNNINRTPLHVVFGPEDQRSFFSTKEEKTDIVLNIIELLLQHNANLEAVDAKGWTPFVLACRSGNCNIVKCILDHGANANHTDLENLTPLYSITQNGPWGCEKIVKLLLQHEVNVYCINKLGQSIIHLICKRNLFCYPEHLFKILFHTQINFNSVDKEGNTPLHLAIQNKSENLVKCLIKYGANINKLDKQNRSPLQMAMDCIAHHRKKLEDYEFIQQWFGFEVGDSENDDPDWPEISYKLKYVYAYEKIIRIIKIHIIKLKISGLKISKKNLYLFNNSGNNYISDNEYSEDDISDTESSQTDILQIEARCEQEIKKMKTESIGISRMTFYDLLTKNIHRLGKNKELYETLNQKIYSNKFPLYISIVKSRLRDAKFRYETINLAEKYFYLNVCERLPDNCIDVIFSFLEFRDINMFIKTMELL